MAIDRTLSGELGEAKDIPQSLVDRLSGAVRAWAVDTASRWFSPLSSLPPVAPEGSIPRTFDYPPGYNISTQPRSYEKVSFATLRALADNYDLMRGVIETRKDQVSAMPWTIRLKREDGEPESKWAARNKSDSRLKTLTEFFSTPDKEHDFRAWIREITEEVLVIDAPVIYPRFTLGGDLYCFDLIDGATIKRNISIEGKTPESPYVAYQQVIKGVPYCDFTRPQLDDITIPQLVYKPRNPRVSKVYGLSPVEQVMMTVNIALRRQFHQLAYFTEGNIPDAFAGVPSEWTPDQIAKFESKWDEIFAGQSEKRRKVKFLPWSGNGALPITFTKDQVLKDELDEYITRLICFFFSIQPNALIKQVNRASGEQMSEDAKDEGLAPLLSYLADILNFLIKFYFSYDDIEFAFEPKSRANAKEQAEIDVQLIKLGVKSVDKACEERGLEAPGLGNAVFGTDGIPVLVEDIVSGDYEARQREQAQLRAQSLQNGNGNEGGDGKKPKTNSSEGSSSVGSSKVAKKSKKKLTVRIASMTRAMRKRNKSLASSIETFFEKEAKRIAEQVAGEYADITGKAFRGTREMFVEKADADDIARKLNLDDWKTIQEQVEKVIKATYAEGAQNALVKLGVDESAAIFDLIDEWSVEYSQRRSAELVGMRVDADGNMYANPDPRWSITNTTRERIRSLVEQALTDGMTPAELADAIENDFAFSNYRAEMISRTELAFANVAGNGKSARESGVVVAKQWILGSEHDETGCECEDNEADGVIPIEADFSSGSDAPPHPNCVCDIVYLTGDEDEED